jgi:hypothetical protein
MYDSGQLERIQETMRQNREEWEAERKVGKAKYWQEILVARSGEEDTVLKDPDYYIYSVGQLGAFDSAHGKVTDEKVKRYH